MKDVLETGMESLACRDILERSLSLLDASAEPRVGEETPGQEKMHGLPLFYFRWRVDVSPFLLVV